MQALYELFGSRPLFTIELSAPVCDALEQIERTGVSHLMVKEGDDLVGVVCACDLDDAQQGATLGDIASRRLVTIEATQHVDAAALRMREHGVSCLPMLRAGTLCGVVTWNDLSRLGVVPAFEEACVACGNTEHVRCRSHGELAGFCLECTRRSQPPGIYDDLGGPG
jgi:acetoin utilization protein AcuB